MGTSHLVVCLSRPSVYAAPATPRALRPARQLDEIGTLAAASSNARALAAQLQHDPALTRLSIISELKITLLDQSVRRDNNTRIIRVT
jgi:hypothetical protein